MDEETIKSILKYAGILAGTCLLSFILLWWLSGIFVIPQDPVRRSVGQVKGDTRNLALALESYWTDFQTYPPVGQPLSDFASDLEGDYPEGFLDFHALPQTPSTTVIFVENWLIADPFSGRKVRAIFGNEGLFSYDFLDYLPFAFRPLESDDGWLLFSPGPDHDFDLKPEHFKEMPDDFFSENSDLIYDSTNGTRSGGDIIRSLKGIVSPYTSIRRSDTAITVSTKTISETSAATLAP